MPDRQTNGQTDGLADRQMDRQMDLQTYEWAGRWIARQRDGQMEKWMTETNGSLWENIFTNPKHFLY